MAKSVYIKGVRTKTVDTDRLALAYLMLARILIEGQVQTAAEPKSDTEDAA